MNGHKFVQRQFYQPIMCALCQEFLLTGEGYQCEDCRYACHKKCYPKVVTKCISKSNADAVSRCLSWVNSADRSRRVTRKRLIIGFRIASLRTRICRRTGAVIAVTCCPSAGRTRSSAQVSTSPAWYKVELTNGRMRSHMPSDLFASCSRLLRDDDGDGEHSSQELARYQDYPGSQEAHSLCSLLHHIIVCLDSSGVSTASSRTTSSTSAANVFTSSSPKTACGSIRSDRSKGRAVRHTTCSSADAPALSASTGTTRSSRV